MYEADVITDGAPLGHIHTQAPQKLWHILDREARLVAVVSRQNPWIKVLDQTLLRMPGAGTILNTLAVTRLMRLSELLLRLPFVRDVIPPVYVVQAGPDALMVARYRWGTWQVKLQAELTDETLALIRASLAQINRDAA